MRARMDRALPGPGPVAAMNHLPVKSCLIDGEGRNEVARLATGKRVLLTAKARSLSSSRS